MTTFLQSVHCAVCAGTSGELYDVHKDKEVCKLLPLKLAGSQQESFVQEEDFPPLTVVNIVTVEGTF